MCSIRDKLQKLYENNPALGSKRLKQIYKKYRLKKQKNEKTHD